MANASITMAIILLLAGCFFNLLGIDANIADVTHPNPSLLRKEGSKNNFTKIPFKTLFAACSREGGRSAG